MTAKEYTQELEAIKQETTAAKKIRDKDEQIMALEQISSMALMLANDLMES